MKKSSILVVIIASILFFSGCSLPGSGGSSTASILKSIDGGKTWEEKVSAGEKKTIAQTNVLSMAADPGDSQVIFLGTKENGIFITKNGADSWENLNFPPNKIYGLAVSSSNSQVLYASGVWQKRGKIYRSEDRGANWKEIYTEPADGTIIVSLAMNRTNSDIIYAGTSEGAIFKTTNGGETWANLSKAPGPVTDIIFDPQNGETAYFLVLEKTILVTKDGGKTFTDLEKNIQGGKFFGSGQVFSFACDPQQSGVIYAGLDKGIIKSFDYGENWSALNILESSREFPIRAIAINPWNSKELMYSAAQAVYKSIDGGLQWATNQLEGSKIVDTIRYDQSHPEVIYLGMRSGQ